MALGAASMGPACTLLPALLGLEISFTLLLVSQLVVAAIQRQDPEFTLL